MRPNQNPVTVRVSRKELCDIFLALDAVGAFWGDVRDSLREQLRAFDEKQKEAVCHGQV